MATTDLTEAKPAAIYWGERDAMIAEVSAWDPRKIGIKPNECRYLVMPLGDVDFDTEWCATAQEAKQTAKVTAEHYSIRAIRV
jgi:hypothetical protein